MTLDRAIIEFTNAFEFGQAYVALSRVRSMEGLSIKGVLNYRAIRASPVVKKFYSSFKGILWTVILLESGVRS